MSNAVTHYLYHYLPKILRNIFLYLSLEFQQDVLTVGSFFKYKQDHVNRDHNNSFYFKAT